MAKAHKKKFLDLETIDIGTGVSKSAAMCQLQWVWKLIQEKLLDPSAIKSPEDGLKRKANVDRTWAQYEAFSSAQRLNEDDNYTSDDIEIAMMHFITAVDNTYIEQGIKGLERSKYELDEEVASYIRDSFSRYIYSKKKKGDLDKAFKTLKKGGVKKPFPSALSGHVPEVIQKIMNEFMDSKEERVGKPPLNITNVIEGYSASEDIKLSTLKDWWNEYHKNALVMFEISLVFNKKEFTDTHVKQIQDNFIEDFRK